MSLPLRIVIIEDPQKPVREAGGHPALGELSTAMPDRNTKFEKFRAQARTHPDGMLLPHRGAASCQDSLWPPLGSDVLSFSGGCSCYGISSQKATPTQHRHSTITVRWWLLVTSLCSSSVAFHIEENIYFFNFDLLPTLEEKRKKD